MSPPPRADPTVFIGGPFKGCVDPATGELDAAWKDRYQRLIDLFTEHGWTVLNAHHAEGWGREMAGAAECTARDFEWMRACDLFLAFPGSPPSPGTHVEIGWATTLRRPVVLLLQGDNHAALVTGLPAIADVTLVRFVDGAAGLAAVADAVTGVGRRLGRSWRLCGPVAEPAG
jgi:hypothetical protein